MRTQAHVGRGRLRREAYGSVFLVHGSRFAVHGSRFTIRSSRLTIRSSWITFHDSQREIGGRVGRWEGGREGKRERERDTHTHTDRQAQGREGGEGELGAREI